MHTDGEDGEAEGPSHRDVEMIWYAGIETTDLH